MSTCDLFFFIDACGAEVIREHPEFTDLAPRWKPLRSVFGYSSACVPSIMSGLYPEEHLHWSFFTHGPGQSLKVPGWIRWLPASLRDRGRVRGRLSPFIARANGITGYFQAYQMPFDRLGEYGHCEPRDIFKPGGLNHGTTFFDDLATTGLKSSVSDWHRSTEANWQAATTEAADPAVRFVFVYDADLDAWLHDHTRQHAGLGDRLTAIRRRIETVVTAARTTHDRVRFYVFSDHGMATVQRHLDPFPILARTGLRMHEDYHVVIDSTMIRLWHHDDRGREQIRRVLDDVPGLRRLDAAYLTRERCAFPDSRFGEDIYLAEPHLLLVPSHMGTKPLMAMHGYDCDHQDSDAALLTDDPTADPTDIVGLNALMRRSIAEAAAR